MLIGIDPGKAGGLCAMAEDGTILSVDDMPTSGGKVCRVGVANLYKKYAGMMDFDEPVNVGIEKIFTRPTDAVAKDAINELCGLKEVVGAYLDASDGGYASEGHFEALRSAYLVVKDMDPSKMRLDGRVGNLNYARGAGMLEMCALWGWPISLIPPGTWMKVMKAGTTMSRTPKERSIEAAMALWPEMFDKEHEFSFVPGRCKKPKDGLVEACLIAEYVRRTVVRASYAS